MNPPRVFNNFRPLEDSKFEIWASKLHVLQDMTSEGIEKSPTR